MNAGSGDVDFDEFAHWFFQQNQESQERMYIVYYKALDGEQAETTLDQLPKLLESGAITEETIIWMDGCEACCRCHYLCGRRQCQCCCVGCNMLACPRIQSATR